MRKNKGTLNSSEVREMKPCFGKVPDGKRQQRTMLGTAIPVPEEVSFKKALRAASRPIDILANEAASLDESQLLDWPKRKKKD